MMNRIFTIVQRAGAASSRAVLAVLILLVLTFGACAPLLDPGPPPTRIQLHPAMPPKAEKTVNKQLTVAMPMAERDIDSDGIALLFNGREVRYLSGVRWTSRTPKMVQRDIVEALSYSGGLHGVAGEVSGISADIKLEIYIRQFCLRYDVPDAPPTAWFSASFKLIDQKNGRLVASTVVEATAPASGTDTLSLVAASEEALGKGLGELTDWVLASVKK